LILQFKELVEFWVILEVVFNLEVLVVVVVVVVVVMLVGKEEEGWLGV